MTASYFTLKGKDEQDFLTWLDTLPLRLRGGQKELLWIRSKKKKSILWVVKEGFIYFD